MDNANPPPTNNPHILPTTLHARVVQELSELHTISTYIDSRLESINRFLSGFTQQPNEIDVDDLEPDDESVDTPLVSPFLDLDDDSDDGEVLNELEEYGNAGQLCRQRAINSFDGDDLTFQYMIGFRKFVAYFDPFLPMNIITHQAYNTIMVEGLESRKAHLLEDKQILSVGVFDEVFLALGWHLEEIHVTWAHLEKKWTRLRLYTKYLEEPRIQSVEMVSQV
ncbi:hypothetical protein Tco_1458381 [Tanacetum coccineum]